MAGTLRYGVGFFSTMSLLRGTVLDKQLFHKAVRKILNYQFTMAAGAKKSVLFVCLGNICRSPIAEAVFRHMVSPFPSKNITM